MMENKIDDIEIDNVSVSKWNVRTLDREKGIDELAENIKKYGLLQPIMVYEEQGKFFLIVGQRRLLAYKELSKKEPTKFSKIKAVIFPKKLDEEDFKILSLSENIQRVELNREDIVKAITFLFNKYKSVQKVSKIIGKRSNYVYDYLKIDTAPKEVQDMYYQKKLSKQDVKRVMELAPQNDQDMISLAKQFVKLTPSERVRAVEIKKNKPHAQIEEVIKESKNPYIEEKVIIPLSPSLLSATDYAAKTIGLDRVEIIKKALVDWLSDKGYYQGNKI